MKLMKSSMTALALAISLASCSDNKNEEATTESTSKAGEVVSQHTTADAGFEQLLSNVPADTAYLLANKKIIPEDILAVHLARSKQALSLWLEMLKDAKTEDSKPAAGAETDSSTEAKQDETSQVSANGTAVEDKTNDFFIALLEDLAANMSTDKIANIGIKVDGHSALYGVDLAPIMRYEITNKDAIKATIARAEKSSGYSVEWQKCGDYDCIELGGKSDSKEEGGLIITLLEKQVALGVFTADKRQAVMDHLTGKVKPETSYNVASWNSFLAENKYKGYGDGYINLKKVADTAEGFILEEAKADALDKGVEFDEASFKACSALVGRHLDHVPEAVVGIKEFTKNAVGYEVVLKTSPTVSSAIAAIPNSLDGMQRAANPVFDLGLNVNFGKLRDGLTQYTKFLISTAEEVHCDAVQAAEVRKAMGGFTMATMMGVGQFKALYVAVNDLKMGTNGKPEKVDFYASVFADEPGALLQMLGMVNPAFATISLPKDGTAVKLPEGLVPPNPTGVNPEIYVSQKDHLLNVMVGDTKPALKPFKSENPVFLWNTLDSKRYYKMIGGMMNNAPADSQDEEAKKAVEMMTKMGEFSGKVHSEMGADSRGIVINYLNEYDQ